MPDHAPAQVANKNDEGHVVTGLLPNSPRSHTHVQQVAIGIPVDLPGPDQC